MKTVGFIGARGLVGSVLLACMLAEHDFANIEPIFFSTSKIGETVPNFNTATFKNALELKTLAELDIIISCQGSEYTEQVHPKLRAMGWQGYWIDSASYLRMQDTSIIVLDPINKPAINKAIENGIKDFIGGNCVTSLMLMALAGLFKENLIEWLTVATYQAASGAGAQTMLALIQQMQTVNANINLTDNILTIDKQIAQTLHEPQLPTTSTKVPLAYNLLPWIDKAVTLGQTKEEQKIYLEANKILQTQTPIPLDSICVRINAMRCHSQAFTIKLKQDLKLTEIEALIAQSHAWIKLIPNEQQTTLTQLTPAAISGTLTIAIGRLRKLTIGKNYLTAFTVGDQLLWGAAEPLRRILNIILDEI